MTAATATASVALCACCKVHAAQTGDHPTPDLPRVKQLLNDDDPAVAHVAAVTFAYAGEVEEWKRLAAAETDARTAENYRKHAAVAAGMVDALAVVAQDAKAVSTP